MTFAEQKALGLMAADSPEADGHVGLSSAFSYSWNRA